MTPNPLTIIILSFNCEETIGRTVHEARRWTDDVRVVDSFSDDETPAVARDQGATVISHEFVNYSAQRNWAMENLPDLRPWQLHLDADEHLTSELGDRVLAAVREAEPATSGYHMPRLVRFLGRELRHGGMYPIYHMRLFRTGRARCEDRAYDQHFHVTRGAVGRLEAPFIDSIDMPLAEWTRRHLRWAEAEVRELREGSGDTGVSADRFGDPIQRKRAQKEAYYRLPPLVRPWAYFIYRYVVRLGFLDGWEGLVFHTLQGLWFRFLVDALLVFRDPDRVAAT